MRVILYAVKLAQVKGKDSRVYKQEWFPDDVVAYRAHGQNLHHAGVTDENLSGEI